MDLVCTVSEPPKIGFDNEASKFITAELLPLPKETLDDHRLLAPNAPSAVRLGAKYPAMCDCPAIFGLTEYLWRMGKYSRRQSRGGRCGSILFSRYSKP